MALFNVLKTWIFRTLCNNLLIHHFCSTWIPHHLTVEQMQTRNYKCEWKKMLQNYPNFLKTLITGGETWVQILILLPSAQQVYGITLILRFLIRQTKSSGKVMMIIFFYHEDATYQHAASKNYSEW